jgi:hypothetical protein
MVDLVHKLREQSRRADDEEEARWVQELGAPGSACTRCRCPGCCSGYRLRRGLEGSSMRPTEERPLRGDMLCTRAKARMAAEVACCWLGWRLSALRLRMPLTLCRCADQAAAGQDGQEAELQPGSSSGGTLGSSGKDMQSSVAT